MNFPNLRKGFTLMELLVVIAIIGILASLMFPAVTGAMNAARKAAAKNDVVQIANAVNMYYTEYGVYPPAGSGNVDAALANILIGINTNDNRRKISFLEISKATRGKSGLDTSGNFVDPWGGVYKIAVDSDYNNEITAGTNSQTLRKSVAVWNNPGSHTNGSVAEKNRRYVTSW